MTQWKLTLSYDGTSFHGWQVQPGLRTIQGTLAHAIAAVTGETVLPQGSGRTDAGVHALAQVTSFALQSPIPPRNLVRALNSFLPSSIRVLAAEPVPENFHARHSAIRKTYEYRIFERYPSPHTFTNLDGPDGRICPVFLAPTVWDCRWKLDFDRLHATAARLIGEHDFAAFAASDPDRSTREDASGHPPSTIRTVFTSEWWRTDETLFYLVSGNGFLHHMVRNLVGTMVDLNRNNLPPIAIDAILASRDRTQAGPTAPAQGLFLVSVEYPEVTP